jgi:hypothetical protein
MCEPGNSGDNGSRGTACAGIWLVRHKHAGVDSIAHEDLVPEALCLGWVDSLIKRLDNDRYAIIMRPRTGSVPLVRTNPCASQSLPRGNWLA